MGRIVKDIECLPQYGGNRMSFLKVKQSVKIVAFPNHKDNIFLRFDYVDVTKFQGNTKEIDTYVKFLRGGHFSFAPHCNNHTLCI
jgi:hypothetical protein